MIYTPFAWVDDDGSGVSGTAFSAARMNAIEAGIAGAYPKDVTAATGGSPTDGDERVFAADAANGIYWRFRYKAGGAYPWIFVGGSPLIASAAVNETNVGSVGGWMDLTAGPSLAVALLGEYMLDLRGHLQPPSSVGSYVAMSALINGVDLGFNNSAQIVSPGYAQPISTVNPATKVTVTSAQTIRARYYQSASGAYAARRSIALTPVRVAL